MTSHDTYFIQFTARPLENYEMHLESQDYPFISDCVKYLENAGWYFDISAKTWLHGTQPGGMYAKILNSNERHDYGTTDTAGVRHHWAKCQLPD